MALRLIKSFNKFLVNKSQPYRLIVRGVCDSDTIPKPMKGLVVGLYQKEGDSEPKLTPAGEKIDERVSGKISQLVKETALSGHLGKGKIFTNLDADFRAIAVMGVGREGVGFNELEMIDEGMENVRVAAGVGANYLQRLGCSEVSVDSMDYPEQAAEGASLATYIYQDCKRKKDRTIVPKLELYESPDLDAWTRGLFKAEAQNLARRLSDAPANLMTPTAFAQAATEALCPCGVTVEVRNHDWIEQNNLESMLIIARGSCETPIILEITYCGTSPEDRPILLVGKGITYNSGGLCLHSGPDMHEYRGCMAGAAVVVAAIRAAAALSLPINISGVIPLCENMPSGMAAKPGDVVRCLNGKTLVIEETDKAGVVVMADPLIFAQNAYKPRLVVDVATMALGVRRAVGGGAAGIFSTSHYIWKQFQKAGALTGDRMWRMPLWEYYKKQITDSESYDVRNKGRGTASSCLAAAALHQFVPCADWAHIDIRGVGMMSKFGGVPYLKKMRMTGRPTRTLIQFLYQMACPENREEEKKKC